MKKIFALLAVSTLLVAPLVAAEKTNRLRVKYKVVKDIPWKDLNGKVLRFF